MLNLNIDFKDYGMCRNNDCTGSIDIIPSTYQITWSNGATGSSLDNLCEGTYSITATNDKGCKSQIDDIEVKKNNNPSLNRIIGHMSVVNAAPANNGQVRISSVSGKPPHTFAWSNGDGTQNISGLAPGDYTVTVTDARGCLEVATVNVPWFGSSYPDCDDDTEILIISNPRNITMPSGSDPGSAQITIEKKCCYDINYTWSGPGTLVQGSSGAVKVNRTFPINEPGTYSLTIEALCGSGRTITRFFDLNLKCGNISFDIEQDNPCGGLLFPSRLKFKGVTSWGGATPGPLEIVWRRNGSFVDRTLIEWGNNNTNNFTADGPRKLSGSLDGTFSLEITRFNGCSFTSQDFEFFSADGCEIINDPMGTALGVDNNGELADIFANYQCQKTECNLFSGEPDTKTGSIRFESESHDFEINGTTFFHSSNPCNRKGKLQCLNDCDDAFKDGLEIDISGSVIIDRSADPIQIPGTNLCFVPCFCYFPAGSLPPPLDNGMPVIVKPTTRGIGQHDEKPVFYTVNCDNIGDPMDCSKNFFWRTNPQDGCSSDKICIPSGEVMQSGVSRYLYCLEAISGTDGRRCRLVRKCVTTGEEVVVDRNNPNQVLQVSDDYQGFLCPNGETNPIIINGQVVRHCNTYPKQGFDNPDFKWEKLPESLEFDLDSIDSLTSFDQNFTGKPKVIPNPASDNIQIWLGYNKEDIKSISILNYLGALQNAQKLESNKDDFVQLNISKLSSGIYFVVIEKGNGVTEVLKFVKN